MPVVVHKRKNDKCNAFLVEARDDALLEAAQWCRGTLILAYLEDGSIDATNTYVNVPSGVDPNNQEIQYVTAEVGDYIIEYWDKEKHGEGFFVVETESFTSEYERE